ncbi:MAG TPA: class I SAM-dependent methyltransferase [Rhizomicrobium sp.]
MGLLNDPKLEAFLDALHAQSAGEQHAIEDYFHRRIQDGTSSWDGFDARTNAFFADKMVALEKDKAEFCYALCRALGARRIVECGTSFGVSTLYLAAAVRDNAAASKASNEGVGDGQSGGTVFATEYEPEKARIARRNFATAGLASYIDLREGDLKDTLKVIDGPVDFVLLDIWTEAVLPAMRALAPHLRRRAVVIADNTVSARRGYAAYFAFVADPANRLRSMTLPFAGGLEMTIRL